MCKLSISVCKLLIIANQTVNNFLNTYFLFKFVALTISKLMFNTNLLLNVLLPIAWSICYLVNTQRYRSFAKAGTMFLCISIAALKPLADTFPHSASGLGFALVYPLVTAAIPILYLYYLNDFSPYRPKYFWWPNLVFVIPALHIFLYCFPAVSGEWSTISGVALMIHDLSKNLMYIEMALVIVFSLVFIGLGNIHSNRISPVTSPNAWKQLIVMQTIANALALGSFFYHYGKFENQWLEWLLAPGLAYLGYWMYKNRHMGKISKVIRRKNQKNDACLARLKRYFEEERAWLDPTLRKDQIAATLGINRTHLWILMKHITTDNFNDYVNKFRVKEAKRLINEGHDFEKTSNIAQQVGFNSYSTFSRAFKKLTGTSPQEYSKKKRQSAIGIMR